MSVFKLKPLLGNTESVYSFVRFREIEDWCYDNIPREHWRFDYSSSISAGGVDIPSAIVLKNEEYASHLTLKFGQ